MQCAAWSPDSNFLVFATVDEPLLYSVSLISSGDSAVPVVDLSEVIADEDDDLMGGGLVQDIVWDPAGYRLAVSYRYSIEILGYSLLSPQEVNTKFE